jgi:hypothetical protein
MPLGLYEMMRVDDPQLIPITQGGKKVKIDISADGSKVEICGKKLSFSDLISRSDYYPLSRFVFNSQDLFNPDQQLSIIKVCFNAYTWTNLSSLKLNELACILYSSWPIHVITYPETTSFLDAFWIVHVPTKDQLEMNMDPTYCIAPKYEPTQGHVIKLYSPKPVVHGPNTIQANQTEVVEFEYRNWNKKFVACDFDTHIKYNAGYLPKNIVKVVDGKAKVKVSALGLEPGDTITLKFSIGKVYTNAVQHTLVVI